MNQGFMLDGALDRVGFFADCKGLAVPKWEEFTFQHLAPLPSISGISDLEGNFSSNLRGSTA